MHKFGKLESLINRVQNSPRPFTSLAWAEKIEPELEAARAAEQQARMVAVTNDPRPEKAMEEVETFVEATDKLKNSVDLVSGSCWTRGKFGAPARRQLIRFVSSSFLYRISSPVVRPSVFSLIIIQLADMPMRSAGPDRLTWLDLTLSRLKISLSGIDQSAATPRQRGEIMGLQDGVHTLAMEVLEMDHAPAEEVVLKVEIVTGLRAKVEGLVYIVSECGKVSSNVRELTSLSDHPCRPSSTPSCSPSPTSQSRSSSRAPFVFFHFGEQCIGIPFFFTSHVAETLAHRRQTMALIFGMAQPSVSRMHISR